MPSVRLSPLFNGQTVTSAGAPASGYRLWTYAAGSSSALATYTDSSGGTPQANPITLNANGLPANPIWLQAGLAYKLVLKDANDVQIGQPWDNVSGVNDTSSSASQWQSSGVMPTYVSTSSFTLPGDQTTEFHAGRRVQFTVTAGTVYGTIWSSAYGANTTVTMAMDAGGALDSGLSVANLSILRADRSALPYLSVAGVQKLINGGAEVAQRVGLTINLSTTPQYGQVDQAAMWASGGAVTAGTLTQNTAATVGRTGKSARIAGATLTGAGQVSWRYRMDARDAVKLKNQAGSFQIAVIHDVGSAINYTIIVRKPTVANNFTATSVISTSSAMSVPSGTATALAFPNITLGDCSNGLEIEVQAACGAVTLKNFDFTEWQLQEGSSVTPFERKPYRVEEKDCRWYLRGGNFYSVGYAGGAGAGQPLSSIPLNGMRATPTTVTYSGMTYSNCSAIVVGQSSFEAVWPYATAAGVGPMFAYGNYLASAEL